MTIFTNAEDGYLGIFIGFAIGLVTTLLLVSINLSAHNPTVQPGQQNVTADSGESLGAVEDEADNANDQIDRVLASVEDEEDENMPPSGRDASQSDNQFGATKTDKPGSEMVFGDCSDQRKLEREAAQGKREQASVRIQGSNPYDANDEPVEPEYKRATPQSAASSDDQQSANQSDDQSEQSESSSSETATEASGSSDGSSSTYPTDPTTWTKRELTVPKHASKTGQKLLGSMMQTNPEEWESFLKKRNPKELFGIISNFNGIDWYDQTSPKKTLYVFYDPTCPHCQKMWLKDKKHYDAMNEKYGINVSWIPIGGGEKKLALAATHFEYGYEAVESFFRDTDQYRPPENNESIRSTAAHTQLFIQLGDRWATPRLVYHDSTKDTIRVRNGRLNPQYIEQMARVMVGKKPKK